ncbi:pyrroline-5-carboxylate reductase [Marinobacter bohaiensis]|uniref:pyrroline-5-carboxylate reductase n=1 Tax=Marinobacter bohaiensis TaxID=2201898 RepID=UPI000DABD4AF|nr:pyrroline-5-carboxylate reductase [Marinobacter bohaiensis]
MNQTVAFIGAGNMAGAIIGGLIDSGLAADRITATSPDTAAQDNVRDKFGIHAHADNNQAAATADVLVLAVKPQILKAVCEPLKDTIQSRDTAPLIISVAAGVLGEHIDTLLGGNLPIVRCMPNTPALVRAGASALWANDRVSEDQRARAGELLAAVGQVEWIEQESLMDAVTAVSGSGPAYFFQIFEAMEEAGASLGLPRDTARRLALQTGFGAACMALASDESPAQLKRNVMSPKGSTEQAIASFEASDLNEVFKKAMTACANRAQEMQKEFSS